MTARITFSVGTPRITISAASGSSGFTLGAVSAAGPTGPQGPIGPMGERGLYINRIINGTMDVWQRGSGARTITTSSGFGADRWYVAPAGASISVARAAGRLLTCYSMEITGATSVTGLQVYQRIESYYAAALTSQKVTLQAQIYNDTGATITPSFAITHANAADNFSANTVETAGFLQDCPAGGVWTRVAYTFNVSASAANGVQVTFDFGNNFGGATKKLRITEVDISVATDDTPIGINNYPEPPQLRPFTTELALCQRYYQQLGGDRALDIIWQGVSDSYIGAAIVYPVKMRANPTASQPGTTWSYGNVSAINFYPGQTSCGMQLTWTSPGVTGYAGTAVGSALALSAEL